MINNDSDVIVFAVSLSNNTNDDITSINDVCSLPKFEDITDAGDDEETCSPKIDPISVTASGQTKESEGYEMVIDDNPYTKW